MEDMYVKPGNQERGWNDPPQFSYGLQVAHGPHRNLLTRRAAPASPGAPPPPPCPGGVAPPPPCPGGMPPPPPCPGGVAPPPPCPGGVAPPPPCPGGVAPPPPCPGGVAPPPPCPGGVAPPPPCPGGVAPPPPCPGGVAPPPLCPARPPGGLATPTPPVGPMRSRGESDSSPGVEGVMLVLQRALAACRHSVSEQVCNDVAKRLRLLEDSWRTGRLSLPVRRRMDTLSLELQSGRWDSADEIHRSLMVDHVTEVSQWMVGVKRLIAETRKLSPELLEPLQRHTGPVQDPVEPVQDPVEPVQDPVEPVQDPVEPVQDPVDPVQDPVSQS